MSCAGKETRCFSSQYPKNTLLCQQEKQERKCPPEHYYVKASVVLSCPTKGFTVDRQRYNLQVKFPHPACTAAHWAPPWEVACVLQPLCSCSPPLLLNFFSKPSSTTTAESLQPPWGSALSSMWGSTQSQRMPRCFCQVVRAHWHSTGGISWCAGAAQCDISVSDMGRKAVYPLCTQQPLQWMAVGSMINESWDVLLSW